MAEEELRSAPVFYFRDAARRRPGEVAELARTEIRHLRALRLASGDGVRLTDGRGALWGARLTGEGAAARLVETLDAPSPLEVELWAPVGNKQATLWLVEKAAEFGLRRREFPTGVPRNDDSPVRDGGRGRPGGRRPERPLARRDGLIGRKEE